MKDMLKINIHKIRINGIGFFVCAMSYIYIAIFIFLIGWLKPAISIPISIIILLALYEYYKKYKKNLEKVTPIYMNIKIFIGLCISLFVLCWVLGLTGFAIQAEDFFKHNGILQDLTNKSWPVYYINQEETSMLTYYIGQYIVPAFFGKILSAPNLTLILNGIWGMLGLFLAVLGVFKVTKADTTDKQIKAFGILLFFSTCLVISQVAGRIIIRNQGVADLNNWFIYNDEYKLQFSNNITLLRWVLPQCIVPWIVFTILYDNRFDIEHYVILCLPILFYSSFSFIGIVIFLFVLAIIYIVKSRNIKDIIKKVFSISNILLALTLGIVLIVYFLGNLLEPKPEEIGMSLVIYSGRNILVYACFIISVLPYTLVLFNRNKKNYFYWIATALLYLIPFVKMGLNNDWCMRVSIIPLFVYNILAIDMCFNEKNKILKYLLIVTLIIGSISAMTELDTAIKNIRSGFAAGKYRYSLSQNANRTLDIPNDEKYNYYTYDLDNRIFYKYLARKQLKN